MRKLLLSLFLLTPFFAFGEQTIDDLLEALEIAYYWDQKMCERFPVTFNHILSTGYFTTHSARMTDAGEIGIGVAHVPPYLNWNGRVQPFCHFELSANYRIFRGVEDPGLSPHGFGDYADRGANFKLAIVTPEQSFYNMPGLAFGVDDFMGSKKFTTYYAVGTQVWPTFGVETSFGWGAGRYTKGPSRGFFGGASWFPFWRCQNKWVRGVGVSAEYDPTNYKNPEREPHPDGRTTHTPINFGAKYTLCNLIELSGSYIRGEAFAAAGSVHYNWGSAEGFLLKIADPTPYTSPVDTQPLGCYRPENVMIQTLNYALEEQGFQLTNAAIQGECLWISLMNDCYRQEHIVRMRLQHLLANLTPSNIETIIVVIETHGMPCQKYVYNRELLLRYTNHCVGPFEFDLLTPMQEACWPHSECSQRIFHRRYDLWKCRLSPRFESFLGSASGKFKYDLGLKANVEGFLPYSTFYELQMSYTLLSSINKISDIDLFNPSQLPTVGTDYIRYRQEGSFTWDKLYIQKNCNFGCGFFGRGSLGYFQVNYGGFAGELLWYPVNRYFALGLQGAVVKKRSFTGLGFQSKLRQLDGFTPTFRSYSTLQQYFLDLYLDFCDFHIFTKVSVGQFLARDKGVRLEATRYFDNGLRLTGWITYTDAKDQVNGEYYYDRGVAIEVPLDFFYKRSCKRVWNYAMAAWLRDAGYATTTGRDLFDLINRERRW